MTDSQQQLAPQQESVYWGWSVGTLGVATLLNTQNSAALFFFVTVLSIEPVVAGAMLTGARLYDLITDPLMGTVTDRTRSRWGRRRPYLLAGGIGCGAAFAFLFSAAAITGGGINAAYVMAALLLLATAQTLYNVPYLAMPAEMVDGYHERSRMMSLRVMFIAVGTLVGTAGSPALLGFCQDYLGMNRPAAYSTLGITYGVLIAAAMTASFFGTANARFTEEVKTQIRFKQRLALVLANKPFLLFLGVKLAGMFAVASILAATFFFVTVVMQRPIGVAAILGGTTAIGQLVTVPLWLAYSRRRGKKQILIVSSLLSVGVTLTWLLSGPQESLIVYGLRGLLLGAVGCGALLGIQAMLPDVIAYDHLRTGLRREGVYAGFISFAEKVAFTLSALVIGGFLSYMGFERGLPGEQQPQGAVVAIIFCQAGIPIVAYVLKIVLLYFYDLDEAKLNATGSRSLV